MSHGHRRSPFGIKPKYGEARVAWGRTITTGLFGAWLFNEHGPPINLVDGNIGELVGSGRFETHQTIQLMSDAGDRGARYTSTPGRYRPTGDVTLFWRGRRLGAHAGNSMICGHAYAIPEAWPYTCFSLFFTSANEVHFFYDDNANFADLDSTVAFSNTNEMRSAAVMIDGGTARIFIDGVEQASQSTTGPITYDATSHLGWGFYSDTARNTNVAHDCTYMWDRALSAAEIAEIHSDPYYSVVEPSAGRRRFVMMSEAAAAAAGGPSFPRPRRRVSSSLVQTM